MAGNDDSGAMDKIANLLALLLIRDMNKSAAVGTLVGAGFSTREIAGLIGSSEGSVRAFASQARKKTEKNDKQTDG